MMSKPSKDTPAPSNCFTLAMVRALIDQGWEVESHTVSHPDLTGLNAAQAVGRHVEGFPGPALRELVRASEAAGFWTLQAGIFPENHASLRLHEKCGFRVLGVRERVGCMAGRWRDVVLLERRSATAGA